MAENSPDASPDTDAGAAAPSPRTEENAAASPVTAAHDEKKAKIPHYMAELIDKEEDIKDKAEDAYVENPEELWEQSLDRPEHHDPKAIGGDC